MAITSGSTAVYTNPAPSWGSRGPWGAQGPPRCPCVGLCPELLSIVTHLTLLIPGGSSIFTLTAEDQRSRGGGLGDPPILRGWWPGRSASSWLGTGLKAYKQV